MSSRLILAAAGSGKTNFIVDEALKIKDRSVLLLTFTNANEKVITDLFIEKNKCVPRNVTIQSWFAFLLQHGVRPFQAYLHDEKIMGLVLVNEKSGFRYRLANGIPAYWPESDVVKHYLTPSNNIFSDKIAKFTTRTNELSGGKVIKRIASLFDDIYIDEVQDLAGYDLEIIKELMKSDSSICLVGDPRQVTYNTHFPDKYKKYMNGNIKLFLEEQCKRIQYDIDTESLKKSHRNRSDVCDLSAKLYPDLPVPESSNSTVTTHDGLFFVDDSNKSDYLKAYNPVQLRLKVTSSGPDLNYQVYNFGDSKGRSFTHTLIFPTVNMKKWLKNNDVKLADLTRAQLYVALTRTRQSIGIYLDGESSDDYPFLSSWELSSS